MANLIEASRNGDVATVKAILDGYDRLAHQNPFLKFLGADFISHLMKLQRINSFDESGYNALYGAIESGHNSIVRILIEHGADLNYSYPNLDGALIAALRLENNEIFNTILENKDRIDLDPVDLLQKPLWHAVLLNNGDAVAMLIEAGASIVVFDDNDETLLMWAAKNGHASVVTALIKREDCPDINFSSEDNETALILAAADNHLDVVRVLINAGAKINFGADEGMSALMYAVHRGHEQVVQLLLDNNADINVYEPNSGLSCLMVAIQRNYSSIAKILIQNNANVEHKDVQGRTALTHAAKKGRYPIAQSLLESGVDLKAEGNDDKTALMHKAIKGEPMLVQVDSVDKSSKTPLWYAVDRKHKDIISLLLNFGADSHFGSEFSPYKAALRSNREDIISVFTTHFKKMAFMLYDIKLKLDQKQIYKPHHSESVFFNFATSKALAKGYPRNDFQLTFINIDDAHLLPCFYQGLAINRKQQFIESLTHNSSNTDVTLAIFRHLSMKDLGSITRAIGTQPKDIKDLLAKNSVDARLTFRTPPSEQDQPGSYFGKEGPNNSSP